jgi:DNA helicase-2/ATP-dependent DNA helicase PcrA
MKEELTQDKTLESDLRLDNLMEFRSITENYQNETGTINLDDFLDDLSLVADIKERESIDDAITLMTIHSAKGLEFKVVFILGMEEGLLPHSNSLNEDGGIEEERRLMYVAITRAKERLYLSNAERRMLYGETIMYPPSRFIKEISPDLIETEVKENNNKYGFVKDNLYSDKNILYKEGEIVFHLSFGKGVVVGSDDRFVTVAFDKRWGIKKFLSNYTGLKRKDN